MAAQTVDAYMAGLDHPHHAAVQLLRAAILGADSEITETVKWNAPNFRAYGEDRVTFRLHPGGRLELVFHRGVRQRDVAEFHFDDPSGLVTWITPDRGVVALADIADATAKQAVIVDLVTRWISV